jgi:2-oxoglutarate dehydrogenase E1 component
VDLALGRDPGGVWRRALSAGADTTRAPESLLSGDNAAWLDEQYSVWHTDPGRVEPSLRALFEGIGRVDNGGGGTFGPRRRGAGSIFAGGVAGGAVATVDAQAIRRQARAVQLINAYRVRGHIDADLDPLSRREHIDHPELTVAYWGLAGEDLDAEVDTQPAFGLPPKATLRSLIDHLRAVYCGSIGAEFMNVQEPPQRRWIQEWLETLPNRSVLSRDEEQRVFRKLCDAENFERMLHARFPGTKRFSLEGAETVVPLLDLLVEHAAARGVREVVMGMAHRGRLNVLVNVLEKPARMLVREFQDVPGTAQGSGDVKYHLGYSADVRTVRGDAVHLSLTPNPSHLEAVDPVVEGRVRAKQDREHDDDRVRGMALLLHGDAAFSGQGTVMETLNLSELPGYATGGTIHLIVNNQIGFTTPPSDARSTPYATDIARMLAVPILHVNGEDPAAVAAVVQLAVEWRQTFHRDVVIDMYCYRKHGHNEGDEPSFTQPKMYEAIRSRPTPRQVYADRLVARGTVGADDVARIYDQSYADLQKAAEEVDAPAKTSAVERGLELKGDDPDLGSYFEVDPAAAVPADHGAKSPLQGLWERFGGGDKHAESDTTFPLDRLVLLLRRANTLPDGFAAHAKIQRLLAQRLKMIDGDEPVDWAIGEQAAFATLLDEGFGVRLSGQDSARGTFSHRHAVIADVHSGEERFPLAHLDGGERFAAIDSSLSELAVLGFEIGYAFDTPDALVLWEAQFGDFSNGAQIAIDQYLVSSEQKWNRRCGLVLLLPHGYEGQGPEHSSARLERFLQLCAEDNLSVANCTTPASFFHLLRRQVLRHVRVPLVVMTPKSLLRHPEATSRLDDLSGGRFEPVLPDAEADPAHVTRLVLCSGKVFYDLAGRRRDTGIPTVALSRVEQLYPFPARQLRVEIERYPGAEVVWCQEEPRNMGAWPGFLHWFGEHLPDVRIRCVSRPAAASPATGSHKQHQAEQDTLVRTALSFEPPEPRWST